MVEKKVTKRVRERPPQENAPDAERIASVLAAPEYSTRAKQAKALGVVDRTLRRWLIARPEILARALELAREASASTMVTGYRRLEGIIAKGNAKNCIAAIKLLAQLRGELTDKHEFSGGVNITDQRLNRVMEETNDDNLRDLIASGAGSTGPEGGGGVRKAKGK